MRLEPWTFDVRGRNINHCAVYGTLILRFHPCVNKLLVFSPGTSSIRKFDKEMLGTTPITVALLKDYDT